MQSFIIDCTAREVIVPPDIASTACELPADEPTPLVTLMPTNEPLPKGSYPRTVSGKRVWRSRRRGPESRFVTEYGTVDGVEGSSVALNSPISVPTVPCHIRGVCS